jgi:protein SCO1/2
MKTKILVLLLAGRALFGAEGTTSSRTEIASPNVRPSCCAACAAEKPVVEVTPTLTARSIYQVEGTWTNDAGQNVALASLRGRPVVIAMFFASCEYACPVLVSDMQRLRQTLPAEARERAQFVLVTFDTQRDTPAALKAYRDRAALDAGWTLLHGDADSVRELAMVLGVKYKQDARGQFSHSNLITVLNDEGEIHYQRNGLLGDVSDAAKAVVVAAKFTKIMAVVNGLKPGEAFVLITPFVPAPLIEKLRSQGFEAKTELRPDGGWQTRFCRKS